MCVNCRTIVNPTKYIPLGTRYPFQLSVPCGHCPECNALRKLEYQYRLFWEMKSCLDNGGYVYFDTLTYDNDHLPHLSDFLPYVTGDLDFPCFSYPHIRDFLKYLRYSLDCQGFRVKGNIRYFISSEYGLHPIDGKTYRPHYHVLFFVNVPNLDPVHFSKEVDWNWSKGRTDGFFTNGASYVLNHNVLTSHSLALDNYVSKYINKDNQFQKELDSRFDQIWSSICKDHASYSDVSKLDDPDGEKWSRSPDGRSQRIKLRHLVDQFHRQSLGFGKFAIPHIDMAYLFKTGCLTVPDSKTVKVDVPLPQYYKRKLFYELVYVDDLPFWQPTKLGLDYLKFRQLKSVRKLAMKINQLCLKYPSSDFSNKMRGVNSFELSDYMLNYKGRIKSKDLVVENLSDRLNRPLMFSYITPNDYEMFHMRFVTKHYLGNRTGYDFVTIRDFHKVDDFIDEYVINDHNFNPFFRGFDVLVQMFYDLLSFSGQGRIDADELQNRLLKARPRQAASRQAASRQFCLFR